MANDLVPRQTNSVEYYSPSSGRVVEVHHHHHYITVQHPSSDGGFLAVIKTLSGLVAAVAGLFGAFVAFNGANNQTAYRTQTQQRQPAIQYQTPSYQAPRCYTQQRREYVGRVLIRREHIGREIVYQERTPYGIRTHYRDRYRDHYQDQYRTYNVQICN